MIMPVLEQDSSEISALYELESSLVPGAKVSGAALFNAVQIDIKRGIPLSRVLFMKQVSSNKSLHIQDLRSILEVLKIALVEQIEGNADASLSYAHAAILCSTEIHSR